MTSDVKKKDVKKEMSDFIRKTLTYLLRKKKQYWIDRIARSKTLSGKYDICLKVHMDDLGRIDK